MSLRPDDPFAKRLLSTPVRTNNLLLKVTVPRRTGRRRKRGSSGPFLTEDEIASSDHEASSNGGTSNLRSHDVNAATIYRSLQDNSSKYDVALAGIVDETHRFRGELAVFAFLHPCLTIVGMPDLQYAASRDDTMIRLRDHILPKTCRFSGQAKVIQLMLA